MTDQLLTPKEAAAYCRVSLSLLANKRIYGGGPNFIKIGMKVSYRTCDLDSWLMAHHVVTRKKRNEIDLTAGHASRNQSSSKRWSQND